MNEKQIMHDTITALIAKTLRIPANQVTDDLCYQSIAEWDSLNHVSLMLALEEAFSISIGGDLLIQLASVAEIKRYLRSLEVEGKEEAAVSLSESQASEQAVGYPTPASVAQGSAEPVLHRGLSGVHFDSTTITQINGQQGILTYRGYAIGDLVQHSTFEEVAYLLIYKQLPTARQLERFTTSVQAAQVLPEPVVDMLRSMVQAHPVDALRTAVSMLAAFDTADHDLSYEGTLSQGIRLLAQLPLLIAAHERLRRQEPLLIPRTQLSFAANFLFLLTGEEPSARVAKILDSDLILHADHSANASAFTARVVTSTRSDLYSAITAAISAFAGSLHGGAVEQVMTMLREIGEPQHAAEYVRARQAQQQPIMGFGHRVYRTEDPRAIQMRRILRELSAERNEQKWLDITDALIEAMKPYARHGVHINVDFYASIIYHLLHIPQDVSVSLFILGRMAGWLAQILEQQENNVLIRPLLSYVGEGLRPYLPFEQRGGRIATSTAAR